MAQPTEPHFLSFIFFSEIGRDWKQPPLFAAMPVSMAPRAAWWPCYNKNSNKFQQIAGNCFSPPLNPDIPPFLEPPPISSKILWWSQTLHSDDSFKTKNKIEHASLREKEGKGKISNLINVSWLSWTWQSSKYVCLMSPACAASVHSHWKATMDRLRNITSSPLNSAPKKLISCCAALWIFEKRLTWAFYTQIHFSLLWYSFL